MASCSGYGDSDGSEDDVPPSAIRQRGGPPPASRFRFRPEAHTLSDDDTADDANLRGAPGGQANLMLEAMKQRVEFAAKMHDGRGSYERSASKGKGKGYAQQAYEHKTLTDSFTIGKPCLQNCEFGQKCGLHITGANLQRAHMRAFGTATTKVAVTDGTADTYTCGLSFAEVQERRRTLVLASISYDAADPTRRVERFTVDGVGPVCAEY